MAWALVQSKKTTSVASNAAISIAGSFASNVTSGNRIFVYTCHNHNGTSTDVNTPTDNQLNTYTKLVSGNTGGSAVFVDIWTAVASSTGTLTITVTTSAATGGELGWTAEEYSGLDASAGSGCLDVSATGTPGNNSTTANASSGTTAATTAANQLAVSVVGDWGAGVTWTVNAGGFTKNTAASLDADANSGIAVGNKTSASGAAEACTWTNGAVSDTDVAVVAVIKLAAVGSTVTPSRRQDPSQRDPGEAYWTQRDRRNALTVGSAANPLPAPLDSAWQAGARYWHLYSDAGNTAPHTWQSLQRALRSDPSLLGTAPTDPLTLAAGAGGDLWRRYALPGYADRREVPQQRPYVSPPGLLDTAELENELLGSADDMRRRYVEPAYYDRREVPQQRPYVSGPALLATAELENELLGSADDRSRRALQPAYYDRREVPQQRAYVSDPLLLTTAELENELLGGAEAPKRAAVPATHAPRWWMPRQPRRDATTPGLLDTAQLENELLGGADTARHYLAAAFYDRREVPQQRPYLSDPLLLVPPVPLDPTLAGWLPAWQAYAQAAIHVDRREVPQQRLYISDPSFYPTTAPTDPLTLAWGAGGTYWLLYATAALQVPRREVPQQRPYVSSPALLATAQLENELLGGADDLRRRYLAAAYYDRREVPAQRAHFDLSLLATALLEDVLLGGADAGRHLAAAYYDRRETTGYQPRWPDPAIVALLADPLLVGGGVGGDRWRRAATPATHADRREVPQQPPRWTVYVSGLLSVAGRITAATAAARMGGATSSARSRPVSAGPRIEESSTSARITPQTRGATTT